MSFAILAPFPVVDRRRSRFARVFGHPARLSIVALLSRRGPVTYAELRQNVPLHPKTLSRHLEYLCRHGCVIAIPDGPRAWYGIDETRMMAEIKRMARFFRRIRKNIGN